MKEFRYKEYSKEEDIIHENAIERIIEAYQNGLNFKEACSTVSVEDPELRRLIFDDALKIMIADLHISKGMTLIETSERLKVPLRIIMTAYNEMLEDVGYSAAEIFRFNNPEGPIGNA
jgi:hypothetical protein